MRSSKYEGNAAGNAHVQLLFEIPPRTKARMNMCALDFRGLVKFLSWPHGSLALMYRFVFEAK
jgi:hypothetical protein